MILRTSGIGVSIAFLREAQWGSRGREFDSRHSDQMIPSRTTVRLGIFLFFGSRRFGKIKINKHFRVCDIDAIYKGINDPAVIILGTFIGRDKELLQQEKDALTIQNGWMNFFQGFQLIVESAFLLFQVSKAGGQTRAGSTVFNGFNDIVDFSTHIGQALL